MYDIEFQMKLFNLNNYFIYFYLYIVISLSWSWPYVDCKKEHLFIIYKNII